MSSEEVDPVAIANAVSVEIAKAANAALAEAVSSVIAAGAEQLEKQRSNARRIDARLEERANIHTNTVEAAVAKLSAVEDQLGNSVAALMSAVDSRLAAYHEIAENAWVAAVEASEATASANAAAVAAEQRIEQAKATEASAQERIAEAADAEARAKRAVALSTLRADVMVDQAVEERRAKLRRKELLAELDRNEAELADKFDAQNEYIDRGMDEYYADVRDRMKEALGEEDSEGNEVNPSEDE